MCAGHPIQVSFIEGAIGIQARHPAARLPAHRAKLAGDDDLAIRLNGHGIHHLVNVDGYKRGIQCSVSVEPGDVLACRFTGVQEAANHKNLAIRLERDAVHLAVRALCPAGIEGRVGVPVLVKAGKVSRVAVACFGEVAAYQNAAIRLQGDRVDSAAATAHPAAGCESELCIDCAVRVQPRNAALFQPVHHVEPPANEHHAIRWLHGDRVHLVVCACDQEVGVERAVGV